MPIQTELVNFDNMQLSTDKNVQFKLLINRLELWCTGPSNGFYTKLLVALQCINENFETSILCWQIP